MGHYQFEYVSVASWWTQQITSVISCSCCISIVQVGKEAYPQGRVLRLYTWSAARSGAAFLKLYTFCDPQRSFEVSWLMCTRACTQILMLTQSALCRPSHRPSLLAIHFYVRDQGGRPAPDYLPTPSFASAPQFTSYFLK